MEPHSVSTPHAHPGAHPDAHPNGEPLAAQRQGALRTALVCGAIALGFFVAAFVWLPR